MTSSKCVVQYWRDCLIDGSRSNPDDDALRSGVRPSWEALSEGKLSVQETEAVFNEWKKHRSKKERESPDPDFIDVIVCPCLATIVFSHGEPDQNQPPLLVPLILVGKLGIKSGRLDPSVDPLPWIPRKLLEPSDSDVTLGTVEAVDKFLTANDWESKNTNWRDAFEFAVQMLETVSGQNRDDFEMEGYEIQAGSIIPIKSLIAATQHLLKLYDHILNSKQNEPLPLLDKYASLEDAPLREFLNAEEKTALQESHVAQMGNQHPLAEDQRDALLHALQLKDGEILAINGPPGTGKTMLLQNIIASLWTQAAMGPGDIEPPVIVATSTNNSAVKNIIESFFQPEDKENPLGCHWLPDVNSFGLYCASVSQSSNASYQCEGGNFTKNLETPFYSDQAENAFLENVIKWSGQPMDSVEAAKVLLQTRLIELAAEIQRGLNLHKDLLGKMAMGVQKFPPHGDFHSALEQLTSRLTELSSDKSLWIDHQKEVLKFYSEAPFWMLLFSWFKPVKSRLEARMQFFLLERNSPYKGKPDDLKAFNKFIREQVDPLDQQISTLEKEKEQINDFIKERENARNTWLEWCNRHGVSSNAENPNTEIDKNLRYKAFRLAQHYWEARWLLERHQEIEERFQQNQSVQNQQKKWRRYAKITPCNVSTLYMVPRFFNAFRGEYQPLYNFIDWLIVDEAGQVTPEVAAPTLALAKKAIVVGDLLQIEPVWSIGHNVDNGNRIKNNVPVPAESTEWFFDQSGMSASHGCLMRIAQRACSFGRTESDRGMFLSGHYRCFDEIVAYCNELAYDKRLKPLRGKAIPKVVPTWGYAHIPGHCWQFRKSRHNPIEAVTIAKWIKDHIEALADRYENEPLKEILGVVTPFGSQARLIEEKLEELGINDITVGTIHRFQGSQRRVIIFSPVYDTSFQGTYFFDRNKNMLNVAVSRARDSFLVFGNMTIFDPEVSSRPSGLLARYLFEHQSNELGGFEFPTREELEATERVRRITSLPEHRAILRECLEKATQRAVIASPYLSNYAIEADRFDDLAQVHSGRIKIMVFADYWLNQKGGRLAPNVQKAVELLQNAGVEVIFADRIHNKTLCRDNSQLVEGSFNWLSAVREEGHPWQRLDYSISYEGPQVGQFIQETLDEMLKRQRPL